MPTWDGVPIDADVTLPETGDGPWPTIAMLHGWGTKKTEFEDNGFALLRPARLCGLTYSDRGWGRSCGSEESRDTELPAGSSCEEGWVRMADQRYENHDTEYLLGLLADEGDREAEGDRRPRRLIRRRADDRAGVPEEPRPPAQRRIHPVDEPQGQSDGNQGGVPDRTVV